MALSILRVASPLLRWRHTNGGLKVTKAKCATVVSALVTAGYMPGVYLDATGEYRVRVETDQPVDAQTVAAFATGQGVTANIQRVDLV